jgi:3-hydroxyethyl bacteriochlorophyllide a dehydrogenase
VTGLTAHAVVVAGPERADFRTLELTPPGESDVVVDIEYSGISAGTERLLWRGTMPAFPGMGYPLVPGYESVGRIREAGTASHRDVGEWVFVPGSRCFGDIRGLFGGAASRVVIPGERAVSIDERTGRQGVLLALAATAYHALRAPEGGFRIPELIIGHGVLGRLIARLALVLGGQPPTVWEIDAERCGGQHGYAVVRPDDDPRTDYSVICDASGANGLLNEWIARLAPRGEIVLAGFYDQPLSFDFSPAFMREARLRIAAEWTHEDLAAVQRLVLSNELPLDGLLSDCLDAREAQLAYTRAFNDPGCLKMVLDWRGLH